MTQVCRYFPWNHQLQYYYFYGETNVVSLSFNLFSCVWSKGELYVSHFSLNLQLIYFKLCTMDVLYSFDLLYNLTVLLKNEIQHKYDGHIVYKTCLGII